MNYLMRYPSAIKPLLFLIFLFQAVCGMAQDFPPAPNPPRLVNDFTGTLNAEEVAQLEKKLLAYSDSTSTQVSIVLLGSVGPYDIADYAFQLGEQWGIGGKGKDNGILILGAMEDRKIFIATGRGMEGAIPDALAKRIVSDMILPNFKMEAYYQGLDQATDMIFKLASGEYTAEEVLSEGNSVGIILLIILLVFLFVVLPIIKNRKDNNNHMGGRSGGIDFWTTLFLANMLGGGGRSSGGGSFGDFSSGGGSFGGFGGGSFGGGGAGGSW
jgi:uncharacterized protein